jgi:flagellar secretion chaperone FliS
MSFGREQALRNYRMVGATSQVAAADPYRLVQLMFENLLERLAAARGHIERNEIPRRGEQISKAIAIVNALNGALNLEQGGEVAKNLRTLYDYMARRLLLANVHADAAMLDEVASLVRNIKTGWDGIPPEFRKVVRQ